MKKQTKIKNISIHPDLKKLRSWVTDSQYAFQDWRKDSWRYSECYDGGQAMWTQEDWEEAKAAGMKPSTINHIFPVCNLVIGSEVINKYDITAKGRSQKDSETGQVMSEGIKFVCDQNDAEFKVSDAFQDAVIPGFGCLEVTINNDPRREKVSIPGRHWTNMWWDPFGDPWFNPRRTKYVYFQQWIDLDDLIGMFPEKKKDIDTHYQDICGSMRDSFYSLMWDESTEIEESKQFMIGSNWLDSGRKRIRPVEIWYPIWEKAWFAVFPDGRAVELSDEMNDYEQYQLIIQSQETVSVTVQKMYVCTFWGDLELQRRATPHEHDEYPYVPFIGYLDRYRQPYGLPRQLIGLNEDINKRKTMALQLLKNRRVFLEKDVVAGGDKTKLQNVYEEANKPDGFIVLESGAISNKKFMIQEGTNLSPAQMAILQDDEREIKELSGANDERQGLESNATSGKAIEKRQQGGATMTAKLFDNLRRSYKMLGELIGSDIQGQWTKEKVLRVTDRLSGADRFVALNELIYDNMGNPIEVRNDITQGKFDYIISEAPQTDTTREKYLDLLLASIQKVPLEAVPQVVPHLISTAFEISDIPNKEQILAKLKPILGTNPEDENMSPQEIKQRAIQEVQAQKEEAARKAEIQKTLENESVEKAQLENEKIKAEIREIDVRTQDNAAKTVSEIKNRNDETKLKRAGFIKSLQEPSEDEDAEE